MAGMLALAMKATGAKSENYTYVDTNDGTPIGVHNRCSGCISNIVDDFIVPLVECS